MTWKCMDSAPTDGTPILVAVEGGWSARVVRHIGACDKHGKFETPWCLNIRPVDDEDVFVDVLLETPLAWMPIPDALACELPEPPK